MDDGPQRAFRRLNGEDVVVSTGTDLRALWENVQLEADSRWAGGDGCRTLGYGASVVRPIVRVAPRQRARRYASRSALSAVSSTTWGCRIHGAVSGSCGDE